MGGTQLKRWYRECRRSCALTRWCRRTKVNNQVSFSAYHPALSWSTHLPGGRILQKYQVQVAGTEPAHAGADSEPLPERKFRRGQSTILTVARGPCKRPSGRICQGLSIPSTGEQRLKIAMPSFLLQLETVHAWNGMLTNQKMSPCALLSKRFCRLF